MTTRLRGALWARLRTRQSLSGGAGPKGALSGSGYFGNTLVNFLKGVLGSNDSCERI